MLCEIVDKDCHDCFSGVEDILPHLNDREDQIMQSAVRGQWQFSL